MFRALNRSNRKPETKTTQFNLLPESEAHSLLTQSISIEEGVFGFEWLKSKEQNVLHYFQSLYTPHHFKANEQYRIVSHREMDYTAYFLSFNRSSCFPFSFDNRESIWSKLNQIQLNEEGIFLQVLLQKQSESWNYKYQQQYLDYLSGIDNPTSITPLRSIQLKALEFIKTKDEWIGANCEIVGARKKLVEIGFNTCIRFVIYHRDDPKKYAKAILDSFNSLSYANSYVLSKANRSDTMNQMIDRKFPMIKREQILSVSETLPFFCAKDIPIEKPAALIIEHEKEPSTPIPVRLSFKLPSLSHLPRGKKNQSEQDFFKHESQINKVLTRINVIKDTDRVKVTDVIEAATVRKVTFQLPRGLNFSSFNESVVKDIKSNMGKNASIDMGKEPNTVALTVPLEKRGKVYLRDLIDTEEFKKFAKDNPLPMLTGIDENGNVIMVCLSKLPHLLGAGTTGSGKSVWLNCVLLVLLLTKTPEEIGIFIIDPKMVEFTGYKDFPHVKVVETDPIKSIGVLASLTTEMDRRYAILAKAGCKNIKQYNANSSTPFKYLVCIIDEYSDLKDMLANTDEDVEGYVRRLGQKARACGIHLIVATQRPDVKVINGTIKAVLPARIAFNCAASQDYGTILDKRPKFTLLGKGDGVCLGFDGIDGLTRFQGALIADDDDATDKVIEAVLNEWKAILKGVDVSRDELQEVNSNPIPTLLERAKFLICEDGKVTQRSLQKSLGIKTEKVKEIFDELVQDEWLAEPDNYRAGYQVNVSAEEIESFGIWFRETFDSQFWGIKNIDSDTDY